MLEKIVVVTAGGHIASWNAGILGLYNSIHHFAPDRFELCGAMGGCKGLNLGDIFPIKFSNINEHESGSCIGADRNHLDLEKVKQVMQEQNVYAGGDDGRR